MEDSEGSMFQNSSSPGTSRTPAKFIKNYLSQERSLLVSRTPAKCIKARALSPASPPRLSRDKPPKRLLVAPTHCTPPKRSVKTARLSVSEAGLKIRSQLDMEGHILEEVAVGGVGLHMAPRKKGLQNCGLSP